MVIGFLFLYYPHDQVPRRTHTKWSFLYIWFLFVLNRKCYFSAWRTPAAGNLLTMTTDIGKRWQLQITNCVYYCTNKCQFNNIHTQEHTHNKKKIYFDFMQTCALHCKCWYIVVGSYWINQFKKKIFFVKPGWEIESLWQCYVVQ